MAEAESRRGVRTELNSLRRKRRREKGVQRVRGQPKNSPPLQPIAIAPGLLGAADAVKYFPAWKRLNHKKARTDSKALWRTQRTD